MSSISEFFHTDWHALTGQDWAGIIITVVTFVLMAIAYFQVFRPKNKKLESYSAMALDDELNNGGKKHE